MQVFATSFWTSEATGWVFTTSWRVVEAVAFVFVARSLCNLKVSTHLYSNDRMYVKDLENLVEIQPPGGDLLSVALRVEPSGDYIPFTPLG